MKDGPVRAGIIGSQFQADCHATAIGMIEEDMSVVAVASPTASHARAFADRHKISSVYNDYKDLAKDPEVEAVTIIEFEGNAIAILSGDFRAVVFGAPQATQALDRSLADDLFSVGAKVRWIGPGRGSAPSLVPWPEIPHELAPVFEIVPLQVAAYRLALWRGITPGDFRFVTEVTASESGFLVSK